IQEKYVEKGYFLAEVTHRLDPVPGATEVDVVFVIREHSKVLVKEINFIGLNQVPADELKGVMATKEGNFLSFLTGEGTYREEMFQRDLAVLQAAYYDRGFINVKVEKPSIALSPDKREIYITLKVEEGEPYDIGKLDFSGDLLGFTKEQLREAMLSRETERFNRGKLAQDIQRITDLFYDEGYAYANVTPVTNIHPENKTIDLTFDLQKGKQVYIERIDLVGNTKTRDKVIRRELRVYEGDLFSGTGMRRSKERVNALGFFETVEVTHKPGSDDSHVVVNVEVKEKATGTFQLGFGFSNIENFIFTAQISQNNFLGWGQTVSASAQISGLRSLVQISYFDPYFLDTRFILSANFFRQQAEFPDFIRSSTGGDVTIGYHFLEDVMGTLTYTREYVNVEPGRNAQNDIPLANRFRSGITSSLRASVTWDRRDNRLFPSRGFVHFASVETAPGLLGGTFLFNRYTAYSRFYVPLPFGFVFKTNLNFGFVQQLDPVSPLPISELYYLGGINTLRGYFLRSISPTALVPTVSQPDAPVGKFATGGNKQLTANIELEFPIFEKVGIRGVLFYDAGNAFAPDANFFEDRENRLPLGLFHSVGFGFRWFSPIGPLRFEWGIPLTKRPEDQPVLFEFTIGNFF
ncbi:MAG TPA: outer membrane protein assembly factor BamA, partial [Myxococcaceae bacterium]|nr:outer membrane protein assembly factor BamA [Myxococcaceae bacterium]